MLARVFFAIHSIASAVVVLEFGASYPDLLGGSEAGENKGFGILGTSRMRTLRRRWFALTVSLWIGFSSFVHAQNCLTPPGGLAHWWRGEGNGFDSISVQDAVLLGGVQFTSGKVGTAFLLSGSGDDYIALPENLFPMPNAGQGTAPLTFEVWFQTSAAGVILGQQDLAPFNSTLGGYVPALYVGTNGLLYAQPFWGTGPQLITPGIVNDGQFHHAVITYDGAQETFYLDGSIVGSAPFIQEGYASLYYYQLGTGYTGGWDGTPGEWFPFNGVIDEPSLYTRALTTGEVTALFNAGTAGKCAPPDGGLRLRHRYSFDGAPSSLVVTDSIRGANGVLVYGDAVAPYTNGVSDGSGFSGNGTLELLGTSGCVSLPPRLISSLSNFTVEAWVTWNGPGTSVWQRVFDFGFNDQGTNANGIGTNYVIFTPARGGTELPGFEETTVNPFGNQVDPESLILTGVSPFAMGEEVYVAITYDPLSGTNQLYFNGQLVASASGVFNPTRNFTDYSNWFGRSQWQRDPFFNGSYNEFRIWEGILSDKDVASHYAAGPDQQFVFSRPTLNIARIGNNLVISWPSDGTDAFQLESATGLPPSVWIAVTNSTTLVSSNYSVTLPASSGSIFYRLNH